MSALNTHIFTYLSIEQAIINHVSVESATVISGYNAQYLRRLLRAGKLDGVKVGRVWLVIPGLFTGILYAFVNSRRLPM